MTFQDQIHNKADAMADQAISDYVWGMQASDIQNILAGLKDPEAKRLHDELENIIDQAVDVMIQHMAEIPA